MSKEPLKCNCLISDEKHVSSQKNLVVFYLVFHLVSRFIPLIQMVIIYWLLTESIIDEFENNKVKLGFVLVAQKFNLRPVNCPYSKLLLFVFNL